jgi:hypothetical protein
MQAMSSPWADLLPKAPVAECVSEAFSWLILNELNPSLLYNAKLSLTLTHFDLGIFHLVPISSNNVYE